MSKRYRKNKSGYTHTKGVYKTCARKGSESRTIFKPVEEKVLRRVFNSLEFKHFNSEFLASVL